MNEEKRQQRHEHISNAAYALLAEYGYRGTSMLSIAKAANASNQTLYRWYGDKDGLFKQMVRDNAATTRKILTEALDAQDEPKATLEKVAPVFLEMLLGERAILLNRAAAADPSGNLGAALSAGGRNEITPLLVEIVRPMCQFGGHDPMAATRWLLGLLVGDWQVRRVINNCAAPSQEEILERTQGALRAFYRLLE